MSFCLFCVVEQHVLKITFHHNVKETLCRFSTNIPAFFRYICWLETDIVASSGSVSHLIYRAFRWYFLTFYCYCTPGYSHRYIDLSLSQHVLRYSVLLQVLWPQVTITWLTQKTAKPAVKQRWRNRLCDLLNYPAMNYCRYCWFLCCFCLCLCYMEGRLAFFRTPTGKWETRCRIINYNFSYFYIVCHQGQEQAISHVPQKCLRWTSLPL